MRNGDLLPLMLVSRETRMRNGIALIALSTALFACETAGVDTDAGDSSRDGDASFDADTSTDTPGNECGVIDPDEHHHPDAWPDPAPDPGDAIEPAYSHLLDGSTRFRGEEGCAIGGANAVVEDLDGDGLDDIVILDTGGTGCMIEQYGNRGAAYVFYGSTGRFAETVPVMEADAILRGARGSVRGVGDVDGDGYRDFAFAGGGGVHLVFGGSTRLKGDRKSFRVGGYLTAPDTGPSRNEYLKVSGAGDVNDDGFDDILIDVRGGGGRSAPTPITTYLVFGRQERFDGEISLAGADAVFTESEGKMSPDLGSASAGDVDDDGFADLLIPIRIDGGRDGFKVGLFYGGARRFNGPVPLGDADAFFLMDSLWTTQGGLGDIDGDGFDDFAVAGNQRIPVFHGREERFTGTVEPAAADFTIESEDDNPAYLAGLGRGDVDGDGYPDIVIGDPHQDRHGDQSGALYVVHGGAKRRIGRHTLSALDAILYGSGPESDPARPADDLGYGVNCSGDVDGDGYRDILVGASGHDAGDDGGRVLLIYGGPRERPAEDPSPP